jgi:cell division protein FtsL
MVSQEYTAQFSYAARADAAAAGRHLEHARARVYVSTFRQALGIVAMALFVVGVLYFLNGAMIQAEYEMSSLRTDIITLERENEVSRMEVAKLEAPARIEKIAETQLGMTLPEEAVYGKSDNQVSEESIHD